MIGGPLKRSTLFVHIERTGGTSIHKVLKVSYPEHNYVFSHVGQLRKDSEKLRSVLAHTDCYIGGHFSLPDFENTIVRCEPGRFITCSCVRDPIERIVSLYQYHLRCPTALGSVYQATKGRGFEYFYDYLAEHDPGVVKNAQCAYLSGGDFVLAKLAVEKRFDCVADQSRIGDLVDFVVRSVGAGAVGPVPHLNANSLSAKDPAVIDRHVGPALRRRIESDNIDDVLLREYLVRECAGLALGSPSKPPLTD